MTLCNMSIEAGARAGLVAVDDTTIDYIAGRPFAPKGEQWTQAVAYWRTLVSDEEAVFDQTLDLDAGKIAPQVTWGTSPEMVSGVDQLVPDPAAMSDAASESARLALQYMDLTSAGDYRYRAGSYFYRLFVPMRGLKICAQRRLSYAADILQTTAGAGGAWFWSCKSPSRRGRLGKNFY